MRSQVGLAKLHRASRRKPRQVEASSPEDWRTGSFQQTIEIDQLLAGVDAEDVVDRGQVMFLTYVAANSYFLCFFSLRTHFIAKLGIRLLGQPTF
jgi:hypothetical protein